MNELSTNEQVHNAVLAMVGGQYAMPSSTKPTNIAAETLHAWLCRSRVGRKLLESFSEPIL